MPDKPGDDAPTILVIDDEAAILADFLKRVVECGGYRYRVLATGNNDAALSIIAADPSRIQLIVQDCVRPLGDCLGGDSRKCHSDSGIRFYTEILRPRFPHLPVIFWTGEPDFCRLRVDAKILDKGCTMAELLDAIRECLAKS
jgi:CheY-like chemotaxis protein